MTTYVDPFLTRYARQFPPRRTEWYKRALGGVEAQVPFYQAPTPSLTPTVDFTLPTYPTINVGKSTYMAEPTVYDPYGMLGGAPIHEVAPGFEPFEWPTWAEPYTPKPTSIREPVETTTDPTTGVTISRFADGTIEVYDPATDTTTTHGGPSEGAEGEEWPEIPMPSGLYATHEEAMAAAPTNYVPIQDPETGYWYLAYKEPEVEPEIPGMPSGLYATYEEAVAAAPENYIPMQDPATGYWTLVYQEPEPDMTSYEEEYLGFQRQQAQQEQQQWYTQMLQQWNLQMAQLREDPRGWIKYWQMQHGQAPRMASVGEGFMATPGVPTTQTPQMPNWLQQMAGGWQQPFKMPSSQQFGRLAGSQQQGYMGYVDWLPGMSEQDWYSKMARLWPQWAMGRGQWGPAFQRS